MPLRALSHLSRGLSRHAARRLVSTTNFTTLPLSQTPLRRLTSHHSPRDATSWTSQRTSRSYSTIVSASDLFFGQPVHETHPHMLKPGEVTPGITAQEYHFRRQRLASLLPTGSVAVLPAATLKYKSGAVFHPYRQESNLWYLTGWEESDSVAVIRALPPSQHDASPYEFTMFCRPKDPRLEQWMGPWNGLEAATDIFNADASLPISTLDPALRRILNTATYVYTTVDFSSDPEPGSTAAAIAPILRAYGGTLQPRLLAPVINALRVVKSAAELANMTHVGRVSGRAFNKIMARDELFSEAEIASRMGLYFSADGCNGHAYVPVVAGGKRGLFVHWTQNTGMCEDGELVTVDAGAEYGGYVADITRTWPVGGGEGKKGKGKKFSTAQSDLYSAVLDAQRKTVSLCREEKGNSLDDLHRFVEGELRINLRQIGFDFSTSFGGSGGGGMSTLFPHHVGHYVGIDVHDVPGYSKSVPLKKGHCITVEPGIYVPEGDDRWPKHFWGMGIRIEDFVGVGGRDEGGPTVFSSLAVKEVEDVEGVGEMIGFTEGGDRVDEGR